MEKTHWKKVVSDPNYIGEADFQEREEIVVTIDYIKSDENVTTADGSKNKAVAHFIEKYKPLILNVTNSKTITKLARSPYFEDWKGLSIQLYIDPHVKAFGEIVSAVRVRPYAPKASKKQPEELILCDECKKDILPYGKRTAQQMAAYTAEKYGRKLCADCATKEAEKRATEAQELESKEDEGLGDKGVSEIDSNG